MSCSRTISGNECRHASSDKFVKPVASELYERWHAQLPHAKLDEGERMEDVPRRVESRLERALGEGEGWPLDTPRSQRSLQRP